MFVLANRTVQKHAKPPHWEYPEYQTEQGLMFHVQKKERHSFLCVGVLFCCFVGFRCLFFGFLLRFGLSPSHMDVLDCVWVHALFCYSKEGMLHAAAQLVQLAQTLCYDLARAEKATDGKKSVAALKTIIGYFATLRPSLFILHYARDCNKCCTPVSAKHTAAVVFIIQHPPRWGVGNTGQKDLQKPS